MDLSLIDIVQLIEPYANLKKVGKEWRGLCPFHKERTPSFFVSQEKGVYYCQGCHKGGNAITFITDIENVDYKRAQELIAQRFGIEIIERNWDEMGKQDRYIWLLKKVVEIYEGALMESEQAQAYLLSRGITESIMKKFRLGYARGILKDITDGEQREYLNDLFLIKEKKGGGYYETLHGRAIFPIWDDNGFIVGIGARTMGEGDPKYLNSRFEKQKVLYGLNYASKKIRGCGYAVVVEGYMDMLSLYQAGIQNVVAVLSSALTKYHAAILKKYTDRVMLMFDPDRAGDNATERAIVILVEAGLDIYIVDGLDDDPDAYIKSHGVEEMRKRIEKATPYIFTIPEYQKKLNFLAKIKNPPLDYIRIVAEEYGETPLFVKEKVDRIKQGRIQNRVKRRSHGVVMDMEREVVAAMVNNMEAIRHYVYLPLFKKYHNLADYMLSSYEDSGSVNIPIESELYHDYPGIIAYGYTMKKNYAIDVVRLFLRKYIDVAIKIEKAKIKEAGDDKIEGILRAIKELKEMGK